MARPIALLATCLALIACGPARAAAPPPPAVAFVGDSLTGGWFATTDAQSFPRLVTAAWHARMVARVGTYGLKTPTLERDVARLPHDTSRVVLEVGTNDFGNSSRGTLASDYGSLVASIRHAAPHASLICLGMWNPAYKPGPDGTVADYDLIIRHACPGRYVDLSPIYLEAGTRGPAGRPTFHGPADDFHPNDQGHAAIAAAIERAARG